MYFQFLIEDSSTEIIVNHIIKSYRQNTKINILVLIQNLLEVLDIYRQRVVYKSEKGGIC